MNSVSLKIFCSTETCTIDNVPKCRKYIEIVVHIKYNNNMNNTIYEFFGVIVNYSEHILHTGHK